MRVARGVLYVLVGIHWVLPFTPVNPHEETRIVVASLLRALADADPVVMRLRTIPGMVEAALAHTVRNPTEAAYARSDLFERRRRLMDDWAAYLDGARGHVAA